MWDVDEYNFKRILEENLSFVRVSVIKCRFILVFCFLGFWVMSWIYYYWEDFGVCFVRKFIKVVFGIDILVLNCGLLLSYIVVEK